MESKNAASKLFKEKEIGEDDYDFVTRIQKKTEDELKRSTEKPYLAGGYRFTYVAHELLMLLKEGLQNYVRMQMTINKNNFRTNKEELNFEEK